MAADKRKKPVSTVRIAANSHDKERIKKNKNNLGLIPYATSNIISLEWDDKKDSVVAKREQIGLSQRHLISFGNNVSSNVNVLADVLTLPREVFEPDIVKEMLSYEVWQTLLSENERHYLMQFLPEGVDIHKAVQELLVGRSNFHFGHPLLKWSASLSSGNLHPDAILHQEHRIRESKKAYYNDLVKYHNSMINSLVLWKERWATSRHPEDKILQEMWRSRKRAGNISSESDSGSSVAEENAGSSDNQNLVTRDMALQRGKVRHEERVNNLAAGFNVLERSKRGERLHKQNIQNIDGSKYMSYIKVSLKQHERVKSSMKHSSNSIQSRSLNRVLGDLHSFHVQPFKIFEEEERKKLHAHWLQLAIKDVPEAFENFKKWQLAKSQLPNYWKQEMKEKLVSLHEADQNKEKDNPHIMSPATVDNGASSDEAADSMEIEEKEKSDCLLQEHLDCTAENDKPVTLSGVAKKDNSDSIGEELICDEKGCLEQASEHDSQPAIRENQHLRNITELGDSHRPCMIDADNDNYVIREKDDSQVNASDFLGNLKRNADASNIWPLRSITNSYPHLTSNSNVGSVRLLPMGYPEERQSQFINLESDDNDEKIIMGNNNMWHKEETQDGSYLSPYVADQGIRSQNELIHHHHNPYLKAVPNTSSSSYHHNHDDHSLFDLGHLQASSSVSVGSRSQYIGNLGDQQLNMPMPLIDLMREKSLNDIQVDADNNNNIIPERMFSAPEGFRYSNIPSIQPYLPSVKNIQQDWAAAVANNTPIQNFPPFQSRLSDQIRGGFSSNLESSSSSHFARSSNRSNIDDGLLYGKGVGMSHCNNINNTDLPYGAPFYPTSQNFIGSELGGLSVYGGGGVPPSATMNNNNNNSNNNNNVLVEAALGDLFSVQQASSSSSLAHHPNPSSMVNNENSLLVRGPTTRWINVPPNPNSAIEDSMLKPFPRPPWNT